MNIPVDRLSVCPRVLSSAYLYQPIDQRAQAREDDSRPVGPREHRGCEGERGDDGDGAAHRVGERVGERRHAAQADERELQLRVEAQPVERCEHLPGVKRADVIPQSWAITRSGSARRPPLGIDNRAERAPAAARAPLRRR